MMKYYKLNNEVFAYELDGSQDHLIGDKVPMTAEEVYAHINPLPSIPQQITALQGLLAINNFGLSVTPTNNFTLDASADGGATPLKLTRNDGVDILTVDADGRPGFPQLANYANDAAAAAAGISIGGLYHTSGTVKIRLV